MAADDRLEDAENTLARRLREAHRRVRELPLSPEEKGRLARRYLAICDLAKRDPERAATRLETFIEGLADTPRARENTLGD